MPSFSVSLQYALPKKLLTASIGKLAAARGGMLTTAAIRAFIKRYGVNMSEAEQPDPAAYATFNEFFTRPLTPGARPLDQAAWTCPVDGAISQFGRIERDQIFQAKGHRYTITALLGGEAKAAEQYVDGHFATLYLSPRDYHRIHMPCEGILKRMVYVPGDLFSVNPTTAREVPGLFARNERVVCHFDTERGPMVLVLVGATIVGSMATVWHGQVNPPRRPDVTTWDYEGKGIGLRQGEEMGRFLLGSTVVLLWPAKPGGRDLGFAPDWVPQRGIRLGEKMADSL